MRQLIIRLDYCNTLLIGLLFCITAPLQRVQKAAARLLLGLSRCDHVRSALKLHWLPVVYRIQFKLALVTFTIHTHCCPDYLTDSCRRSTVIRRGHVSTRHLALTILFHRQEHNLAIEPSLWLAQLYGTVD